VQLAAGHRAAATAVTLLDPQGIPLAGREVTIEQVGHAFDFGNIGFEFVGHANGETDDSPAIIFGGAKPSTAETLEPLWFAERGATIKGHPLVWHTLAPQWLMDKSDAEVEVEVEVEATIRAQRL